MKVLTLPRIKIHNANALSSPFTVGFPAMTAWLGFVHALERKLKARGLNALWLKSVAVVNHEFDLQTHKGPGDYVHSIIGTGNPLNHDGTRSAFIEEARCHLCVSLVIEYEGHENEIQDPAFLESLRSVIHTMKMAGGDIFSLKMPTSVTMDEDEQVEMTQFLGELMPGYVLIERRDLMIDAMKKGEDALDAMLGFLTLHHESEQTEPKEKEEEGGKEQKEKEVIWRTQRKVPGWIVPIATGFQGISALAEAKNQRDAQTPHRFAESIVTLGEFIMVNQIKALDDMLWHYLSDLENDLYLCQQNNKIKA